MALCLKLDEPALELDFADLSTSDVQARAAELACAGRQGSRNGGAERRFRECNILIFMLHSRGREVCASPPKRPDPAGCLCVRALAHMRLKLPVSP